MSKKRVNARRVAATGWVGNRIQTILPGLIFLLLPSLPASALSFMEMNRELPGYHPDKSWNGRFAVVNDSMGMGHSVEWDDGRTSSFEFFLKTPLPIYLEMSHSSFTLRGESASIRADAVHFLVGAGLNRPFLEGQGWAYLGLGGLFLGDLGGFAIQNLWHKMLGIQLPIPGQDEYGQSASAFLFTAEVGFARPFGWPLAASLVIAGSSLEYWEVVPAIWASLESPYGSARIGMRYHAVSAGRVPLAAKTAFSQNQGPWIDIRFSAHAFFVQYSLHLHELISMGTVGFQFTDRFTPTPDAQWHGDFSTEYVFVFGGPSYMSRSSWTPRNWRIGKSQFSPVLALHSGWQGYGRIQKTLLGAEWSLTLGRKVVFEPYGSFLVGYTHTRNYGYKGELTNDSDKVQDSRKRGVMELRTQDWFFTMRMSAGLRFFPFHTDRKNRVLRYGLLIGGITDFDIGTTSDTFVRFFLGITFSDDGWVG